MSAELSRCAMTPIEEYDYELPQELIAQQPLAQRDHSRLMIARRERAAIEDRQFRELPDLLRADDCLVLNDTRVVPARLIGRRLSTGGKWEGLFLRERDRGHWELICQTRGKLRVGERVAIVAPEGAHGATTPAETAMLELEMLARGENGTWFARPLADAPSEMVLERFGRVPLPPYIHGGKECPADREQYQTVYAKHAGAVAVPTAGLHFTPELLERLRDRGVAVVDVTLHVGLGTFKPMTAGHVEEHRLHSEWGTISPAAAEEILACRRRGGRVVSVGTTTLRLLETAAADRPLRAWSGETALYIYPPYPFRAVDALVTNFHLPRTSLLVLVSAFAGRDMIRAAYEEAIRRRYRFYSYGDAMLIL